MTGTFTRSSETSVGWFGMVAAVGMILVVLGVWNAIDGLRALIARDFVVADAQRIVALQVARVGWVLLAPGIVDVVAIVPLFICPGWARVIAVLVASFNGVVQLAFTAACPVGVVLIPIVSAAVIWKAITQSDAARVSGSGHATTRSTRPAGDPTRIVEQRGSSHVDRHPPS
jgi:hypothetical protein